MAAPQGCLDSLPFLSSPQVRDLNAKTAKRIESLKTTDSEELLASPLSPKAAVKSKSRSVRRDPFLFIHVHSSILFSLQQQPQQNHGRNSNAAVKKEPSPNHLPPSPIPTGPGVGVGEEGVCGSPLPLITG